MPSIALPVSLRGQLLSGSKFSPYSLFTFGTQGIWFDPSDLTTMYQDAAGTTAVTTPGQPVGLRLDKSKGLVLGAELVTAGWTDIATTTSSIVGGKLRVVGGTNGTYSNFSLNTKVGGTYLITFNASVVSPGTFYVIPKSAQNGGGSNITTLTGTTNTSYRGVFVATTTSEALFIQVAGTWDFDNISVRELPGNHATQSVLASRPVYGIEPAGGRRNLLTWSEDFGNAVWVKQQANVSANAGVAPDGTTTADRITSTGGTGIRITGQTFTLSAVSHTISVWVKAAAAGNRKFRLVANQAVASAVGTASAVFDATDEWQRFSFTATGGSGYWGITQATSPDFDHDLLVWGAQLELGSTATNYQRVTTAYDITESGVATCHYIQYDGSDDGMITNSIDFTATDKMSVFAGVRKLSDAASGTVLDLNGIAGIGSIMLRAPSGASANYAWYSGGSIQQGAVSANSYAAPITNVLTGLADISGDLATLRANGTQIAQVTADQGTGNFSNLPLYFGRRQGTALPLNGRDYGIVVVGKATTADEITSTEKYMAGKTGVTL